MRVIPSTMIVSKNLSCAGVRTIGPLGCPFLDTRFLGERPTGPFLPEGCADFGFLAARGVTYPPPIWAAVLACGPGRSR
ncbi:hypothetical protein G6F59_018982 [Rhizopus arrhizus]|nr:hypothetical protein G6F59_018982 [Rhizopus arrhizus]